jgi:small subunit ribosomal protein S2
MSIFETKDRSRLAKYERFAKVSWRFVWLLTPNCEATMVDLTVKEMIEAGIHFGHKTRYWNPKMGPYIYGARNDVHIIDLDQTNKLLRTALDFIEKAAQRKAKIMFVGTKRAASNIIKTAAQQCQMPYVNDRWLGGMLTNYKTIRQLIKRLKELEAMRVDGTFDKITKKEVLMLTRQIDKLERSIGGIKDMVGLPDMLFIIDVGHEHIAVSEARRLGIPIVGVVDTNNTPDNIDYVIPGNDDGMRAIQFYADKAVQTILATREKAAAPEAVAAPAEEAIAATPATDAAAAPAEKSAAATPVTEAAAATPLAEPVALPVEAVTPNTTE